MNRTILVGRMVKDPELKYSSNGVAICSFTIAINRTFTNQQGEREADFPNIVCFKRTAENTANFCKKGSLVGIDGRLQTRSYDTDNGKRYVTEVMAESVQFLEPKGNSQGNQNNGSQGQQRADNDPFAGGSIDISDDNLPF